jgi:ABC-type glycerol-3-phosphate transport system substrate-binding protein
VEVLAVWEDDEAARFRVVLDRFEALSGARVSYVSTAGADIGTVLDARLATDSAPDVAIVPLPSLIARYAREGVLVPLDDLVGRDVRARFPRVWRELGTVDGHLYGVWVKAAHKSLIWYRIGVFEDDGVVPPTTLDGLERLVRTLAEQGVPAFAVGGADAWTLTDWFENLYLRWAGPQRYDALARGDLAWTDPTVVETLSGMARLLAPDHVVGGAGGALGTTFPQSVQQVFGPSPSAAMIAGGNFVAGFVRAGTASRLGVDADVFLFPEAQRGARLVVGGGDAVVLLRRTPAGEALVRFLAGPEAGELWAGLGGFLSPNTDVDLTAYPDDRTRFLARTLLEAGDEFRFDLSDLLPPELGGTAGSGLLGILQRFLQEPSDPVGTAQLIELAATSTAG